MEIVEQQDAEQRVRDAARVAIGKIREQQPVPEQVAKLREKVDELEEAKEQLKDRLEKIEQR